MTDFTDSLSADEMADIERANASGRTPVVFVHGLWLLSSSWQRWRNLFEDAGYATVAPGWPDDPTSVERARNAPEAFAHKTVQAATEHYASAIGLLARRPAVVGHSFGGLIAQKIAGAGLSAATVAIDNAPFKGVLPLPLAALKSSAPVLANPANRGRAVTLSFEQFKYGWANNLDDDEAIELYNTFHVPAAGAPVFQAALANLNVFGGETAVDHDNPDRGPLLIIAGENDNTVPLAITNATYKIQSRNPGVTEIAYLPDRGHSLVIDHGWLEVATAALDFVRRFMPTR
ncbi:MAG: alpha/beta hydrolase [Actinobacteria bacterium]|nr:alpha/beta hydrolase [Actinomycetota bacterium]